MDGYVVEKAPESRDFERRTTKDFEAQTLTWSRSEEDLTILGANSRSGETGATDAAPDPARPLGVYKSARGEGSLQVSRVTDGVQEMVPGPPDSGWVLLALEAGDSGSRLALLESGEEVRPFAGRSRRRGYRNLDLSRRGTGNTGDPGRGIQSFRYLHLLVTKK